MSKKPSKEIYKKAYSLMCTARAMSDIYEENKEITSKYVHATSKGHEAIQLAVGLQLTKNDWTAPYYRDCLLYTSPSPRDRTRSRMPSSA